MCPQVPLTIVRSLSRPFSARFGAAMSNENFFLSPQAAAVYKHELLKQYIPKWVGKVGSTSINNRLIVYDAYSGPGRYEDDQPGSPELLVDTADAMARLRKVHTIFSEKDQAYCARLRCMLAEKGLDPRTYEVLQGPVENHVDDVLQTTHDLPLFVFLDPFGLTIPFDRVVHVLQSRDKAGAPIRQQPKTEMLMNFSYEAVRRNAGALLSTREYVARAGQARALDEALGGTWWRDFATSSHEGWVHEVLNGYAHRVAAAAGSYGFITADVADSMVAKPVYELLLFTRHRDGLWEMARSMSMARKKWRNWLVERREQAAGGQAEMRGLEFEDNEEAWVDEIGRNIASLLKDQPRFVIEQKLDKVLGRTLGLAREMHIRQALKELHSRRAVEHDGKGDLQHACVARRVP
jgi:three-Cys-motif partner protein